MERGKLRQLSYILSDEKFVSKVEHSVNEEALHPTDKGFNYAKVRKTNITSLGPPCG